MKVHYTIAALLLAQAAITSSAFAAEGFQISPRLGTSTLQLDADTVTTHQFVEKDTLLAGVTLAYVAPFGLLAEAGYSSQGNSDWFNSEDKYKLSEYTVAVGFQIDTPKGFRITPKVGRTRWDLYSKEGLLTQVTPGEHNTRRGYDDFWELTLQKEVSKSVALGLTFKDNPYDFGNVKTLAFTASFGL